jgi:hypothetical protein
MRIAYFVHNLADPAVGKRIRMLRAAGDEVLPIGFHRDDRTIEQVEGIDAIDLGQTFDANFKQRIAMVAKRCADPRRWADPIRSCEVIIARNLEMLVIAAAARRRYARQARLAYEALDIHRLLLSDGMVGAGMRALERMLMRKVELLIVSSPAFLREYFEPMQGIDHRLIEVITVENKLLPAAAGSLRAPTTLPPGPPWRIGWFGMIRCRKSLDALCDLAIRRPDLVQVIIRGRPSRTEFDDFDAQVERTPGVAYGGTYRPAELEELYGSVHFNWTLDFFEEGANSRWLLPNRIYEGGVYDAVPVALTGTETARWLKRLGTGVFLDSAVEIEDFLASLTSARYEELKQASGVAPRSAFVADDGDCARLSEALRGMGTRPVARTPPSASVEFDFR